jgi:hypothetical protein
MFSGVHGGAWDGPGLNTSSAASDTVGGSVRAHRFRRFRIDLREAPPGRQVPGPFGPRHVRHRPLHDHGRCQLRRHCRPGLLRAERHRIQIPAQSDLVAVNSRAAPGPQLGRSREAPFVPFPELQIYRAGTEPPEAWRSDRGSKSRANGHKDSLRTCDIRLSPSEESQTLGDTGRTTPQRAGSDPCPARATSGAEEGIVGRKK